EDRSAPSLAATLLGLRTLSKEPRHERLRDAIVEALVAADGVRLAFDVRLYFRRIRLAVRRVRAAHTAVVPQESAAHVVGLDRPGIRLDVLLENVNPVFQVR